MDVPVQKRASPSPELAVIDPDRSVEHVSGRGRTLSPGLLHPAANATHGRARRGCLTTAQKTQALVVLTNEEPIFAEDAGRIARCA